MTAFYLLSTRCIQKQCSMISRLNLKKEASLSPQFRSLDSLVSPFMVSMDNITIDQFKFSRPISPTLIIPASQPLSESEQTTTARFPFPLYSKGRNGAYGINAKVVFLFLSLFNRHCLVQNNYYTFQRGEGEQRHFTSPDGPAGKKEKESCEFHST